MATIFIQDDEVYRTRIEDVTNDRQFFYPVYKQARDSVYSLIKYTARYWNEHTSSNYLDGSNINPMRLRGYPNNIIAFCADRGHGKTSAMLSFSQSLQQLNGHQKSSSNFWHHEFYDYRFFTLEPIDPTVLENTDHIIPTIISRMFTEFSVHANKLRMASHTDNSRYNTISHQELRERQQQLLKIFQDCYRMADEQKDNQRRNDSYDDLQLLADRGDSSNFKVHFCDLVQQYLKFMCLGPQNHSIANSTKSFLVIQIDDADMNPKYAYDVVEDLRKYCVLPNVIILFATNLEQLEMCVEQHFLKSFDTLIKSSPNPNTDIVSKRLAHCRHTTASYLDKLIPSLHRINLPDINNLLHNYGTPVYLHHNHFHGDEQRKNPEEYQSALVRILKDRCLISLVTESNRLHLFLPSRMRDLTHLLNRLTNMEPSGSTLYQLIKEAALPSTTTSIFNDARQIKKNLEDLIDYLVYDWCDLILESWQRNVIHEVHLANTERKIAVCLRSVPPTERQKMGIVFPQPPNKWTDLVTFIEACYSNKQDYFSCALELYFVMYRELLAVSDCYSRMSIPPVSSDVPMKITTLGECNRISYSFSNSPKSVIGGFEFKLDTLYSRLDNNATLPEEMKQLLNNYLYVKNEEENPNQWSISELYESKRDTTVIFDPLGLIDLNWTDLTALFTNENESNKNSLSQLEIRLALFANRPLQHKLVTQLAIKQREYQRCWVHFPHRIKDFWKIANQVCQTSQVLSISDPSPNRLLEMIYFSNDNNHTGYLLYIQNVFDEDNMLVTKFDFIIQLLENLYSSSTILCSKKISYSNQANLINNTFDRIYKIWCEEIWPDTTDRISLDTCIANNFYREVKAIDTYFTGAEPQNRLSSITPRDLPKKNTRLLLKSLTQHFQNAKKSWIELKSKNTSSDVSLIENAQDLLSNWDNWIECMKSKFPVEIPAEMPPSDS